jgi:RNA polymerase sigma-B factor
MPLAVRLARQYVRSSEPIEDLVQVAMVGLVKAANRFDPSRGGTFAGYAIPTILGELRRYFRDSGWTLHVPRAEKMRALKVRDAERRLTEQNGRSPSAQTIAAFLDMDLEQVILGLQAMNAYSAAALEGSPDESSPIARLGTEDPGYERAEQLVSLGSHMRQLDDSELELLSMRFYEGLSQEQIACRIGVSQMQVSRLLSRVCSRLRSELEDVATST